MKVATKFVTRSPKLPKEKIKPNALKIKPNDLKVHNVKGKELKAKKTTKTVVAPKR
jgi:hypothetical protein